MTSQTLHELVKRNDMNGLDSLFASENFSRDFDVNAYDRVGYTALMHSVMNPDGNPLLVKSLLAHGADVHMESHGRYSSQSVMSLALGGGSPAIVILLLQAGANIHYRREENYGALLDAVHNRDIFSDQRLIELLKLLTKNKVELSDVTSYSESGLRVLSRLGRFDAVGLLLDAGADFGHLEWTPLMRAVALGTLDEVKREVEAGASLEDRDSWERTPWLLALQTGDLAKARFLYEIGSDLNMRGRCKKPPLLFAVESGSMPLIRWLLDIGAPVDGADDYHETPLLAAIEANNLEIVAELVKAGADLQHERFGKTALSSIQSREMGQLLLNAGAELHKLGFVGQRVMLGLNRDTSGNEICVSEEDFERGWSRKFGTLNPERIHDKFCESMIRAGIPASVAANTFEYKTGQRKSPVWSAQRFGQSITFMQDNRIIQIAGEHEDFYDKDFCIYNDVFVYHPNGEIEIFGYPEEIFPPTDFHTATLLENHFIWVIGNLGYAGKRAYGKTPVFRLDAKSMKIEGINTTGTNPGWIYEHTATIFSDHEVRISGGKIVSMSEGEESHEDNEQEFILDTRERHWRCAE
jgi:ankyrin repeat protein